MGSSRAENGQPEPDQSLTEPEQRQPDPVQGQPEPEPAQDSPESKNSSLCPIQSRQGLAQHLDSWLLLPSSIFSEVFSSAQSPSNKFEMQRLSSSI